MYILIRLAIDFITYREGIGLFIQKIFIYIKRGYKNLTQNQSSLSSSVITISYKSTLNCQIGFSLSKLILISLLPLMSLLFLFSLILLSDEFIIDESSCSFSLGIKSGR